MLGFNWNFIYGNGDNVDTSFNQFLNAIVYYFNVCFPVTFLSKNKNNRIKWYNDELKTLKGQVLASYNIYKSTKTENAKQNYLLLNRNYKKSIENN